MAESSLGLASMRDLRHPDVLLARPMGEDAARVIDVAWFPLAA